MALRPTSTIQEIEAAYLENVLFEQERSECKATNLIQAAEYWLLRQPIEASGDGRQLTLNVAAVRDLARRARLCISRWRQVGNNVKILGADPSFRYPQGY